MEYDEEIERVIELDADDFVELFRSQVALDDGTRIHISNNEFLRAMSRLDPASEMSDEQLNGIEKSSMEESFSEDERDDEYDRLLHNLSISGEIRLEAVKDNYGDWAVDRLKNDDRVVWSDFYSSFSWPDDEEVYGR